jgi:hypothetical protein
MNRYAIFTIALLALLVMPGCAFNQEPPQTAITDTFCLTSKKRKFSIDRDTPERIREARIHNEVIDRRCGIGRVAAS